MPQTVEEALAGLPQLKSPGPQTVEEALAAPLGPAPKKYAMIGGKPVEIDYQTGIPHAESVFLANLGGNAKMQAAFLNSRGFQTGYHPDTGELLAVGPDGKAHPMMGAGEWADPSRYMMDAATMWLAGGGGKLGQAVGNRVLPGAMQNFLTTMLPGQVLGVAGARTLQQGVGQSQGANQINPAQIGKEAAINYGIGATLYGGAQLFGQGGGVPASQVDRSVQNPALLKRPAANAERNLSENLAADVEQRAGKTTFGHEVYQQQYLEPLKGMTLDVQPYVDSLKSKMSAAGDNPALRTADRAISGMADRLAARASLSGGRMTAGELDAWIRENMTDPLKGAYTRGSEATFANRLMEARTDMTNRLYASLGPGASSAQKLAESSLSTREAVEKTFPAFDKAGKVPVATGAERLRMVTDPGPQGQTLRQILQAYDTEHGTMFLQQANDLGTKALWNAADRVKAQVIDNALKPQYIRLGVIKQGSRMVGKQLSRATHHVVPLAGGVRGMVDNHPKRLQQEQSEAAPEELFPGTTNAPPQEAP